MAVGVQKPPWLPTAPRPQAAFRILLLHIITLLAFGPCCLFSFTMSGLGAGCATCGVDGLLIILITGWRLWTANTLVFVWALCWHVENEIRRRRLARGDAAEFQKIRAAVQAASTVDSYLTSSEEKYPDIIENCEKRVFWADDSKRAPTEFVLVYIHGWTANRQEVSPLCEDLAESLGMNLLMTRLTGHGRYWDGKDMAAHPLLECCDSAPYLRDVMEAFAVAERLGERIILVGMSYGGTLAAWLNIQPWVGDKIAANVYLAPFFSLNVKTFAEWQQYLWMLWWPGRKFLTSFAGAVETKLLKTV